MKEIENKPLSKVLKEILHYHTTTTIYLHKILVCNLEIEDLDKTYKQFSYSNCDSRYEFFHIKETSRFRIKNKNSKITKLESLNFKLSKVIKKIITEYSTKKFVTEKTYDTYGKIKETYYNEIIELIIESEELEKKYDGLTNFFNKKYFLEEIKNYTNRDKFCIVMADIDHFKNVNDTYGHPFGDHVLITLSELYRDMIRSEDIIGRYGGEEFIIFLKGTENDIFEVINRIRKKIESTIFTVGEISIKVTTSFGIAQSKESLKCVKTLIKNADKALYSAKNEGRNQVVKFK